MTCYGNSLIDYAIGKRSPLMAKNQTNQPTKQANEIPAQQPPLHLLKETALPTIADLSLLFRLPDCRS